MERIVMRKWFLVLRPFTVAEQEWLPHLDEHLSWMKEQHDSGHIVYSGPSADRAMGMYLLRADSAEDAAAIAGADPFTVRGQARFDLIEWEIHQAFGVGPFTAAGLQA
jgi:uncharacterized protein YciI